MSVIYDPDPLIVAEDPDWHWRIVQRVDGPDVDIELAPLFYGWDGDDLTRLLRVIARKLQYTASQLLSAPTREGDDE